MLIINQCTTLAAMHTYTDTDSLFHLNDESYALASTRNFYKIILLYSTINF